MCNLILKSFRGFEGSDAARCNMKNTEAHKMREAVEFTLHSVASAELCFASKICFALAASWRVCTQSILSEEM